MTCPWSGQSAAARTAANAVTAAPSAGCTGHPQPGGTHAGVGTSVGPFRRRLPAPVRPGRVGGVCYFSCSRAAVRKMEPRRWVNAAWVVTRAVNQSSWLPSASFCSASTTDSNAAW